ncbi:hypothetical protein M422DRAFT_242415 [Sphaerobolus stellatus SS14]|nr:hypothetical protein M422DRAFT_242415 [Sphaerobolus stellatus SS14]
MYEEVDDMDDLPLDLIVAYRELVFPLELAEHTHSPYFSIESTEEWVSPEAIFLFLGEREAGRLSEGPGTGYKGGEMLPKVGLLKRYKKFILPVTSDLLNHPFFRIENARNWLRKDFIQLFQEHQDESDEQRGRKSRSDSISSYISVQADSRRSSSCSVSFSRSERSIQSSSSLSARFLSREPSPDVEINDLDPNPPILQAQKRKLDISETGSVFGSDNISEAFEPLEPVPAAGTIMDNNFWQTAHKTIKITDPAVLIAALRQFPDLARDILGN